jgi:endonuclease/exonuclease/phosphatase family metal-dependent hydrolase
LPLVVRSWNVYHGRTFPPSRRTHLERMVRLVTLDAPDIVALQEVPVWALGRLSLWSGMTARWAITVPALLGPLARRLVDLDPVRFRSTISGQANAILVNPRLETGAAETLVLNPEVSRWEWLFRGRQRRMCQRLEVEGRGRRLVVANLHATNHPRLAEPEVLRAADFVRDAETCVLCGDFNVVRFGLPGFSAPIDGIDQVLVRGLEYEREPVAWARERRRVDGGLLSDHAPVEAVIA